MAIKINEKKQKKWQIYHLILVLNTALSPSYYAKLVSADDLNSKLSTRMVECLSKSIFVKRIRKDFA